MKSGAAKWLALLLSVAALPAFADDTLVLIVGADSKVDQLDSLQALGPDLIFANRFDVYGGFSH